MIVHCVQTRLRSFSSKKTISSSSFLGWLVGRGAVKTLIDWYVRRRHRRAAAATTAAGTPRRRRHEAAQYAAAMDGCWQVAVAATVQCVCVCHRSSSKRAAVSCPAEKPSESPITARPILESCRRAAARRPLFFYIHVSHFEICSTFSAWLDILSAAFPQTYYTKLSWFDAWKKYVFS